MTGGGWPALVPGVIVAAYFTASKLGAMRVRRRYRRTGDDGLTALTQRDGWHVTDEPAYRFFSAQPPPRRWTVRQQLALDLRSPVSIAFWLFATAGTAAALALHVPALLALGLPAAGILAFALPTTLRFRRGARVATVRTARVDDPAMFARAYAHVDAATADVPVVRNLKLLVPWTPVRALIDRHGSAEMLVLLDRGGGQAIGVRAPTK